LIIKCTENTGKIKNLNKLSGYNLSFSVHWKNKKIKRVLGNKLAVLERGMELV